MRAVAVTVLGLALLCLFAWAVRDASLEKRSLGRVSGWLEKFSAFPEEVAEVLSSERLQGIPDSFMKLDSGSQFVGRPAYDLVVTNSFWDPEADRWEIRRFNFRNDSVRQTWYIERRGWMLDKTDRLFENAPAVHSLPLADGSLICKLEKTPNLMRLDKDSKVLWANHDLIFHHAIQPDPDGTSIWVCASEIPAWPGGPSVGGVVKNVNGHNLPYQDDYIARVDIATGRLIFKKGVAGILRENGRIGVLYGGGLEDPMHLNDVVPVRIPSTFWMPGDLLISIKRRSMVLLYRPSTNELVDIIEGPFISQHDVNVISDHEISVFNNRYITRMQYPRVLGVKVPEHIARDTLNASRALIFDFKDRSFREVLPDLFQREGIHTETQGILELLPNGDVFVEAQNMGLYFVLSPEGVLMRRGMPASVEGYVHGPNWSRLDPVPTPPSAPSDSTETAAQ